MIKRLNTAIKTAVGTSTLAILLPLSLGAQAQDNQGNQANLQQGWAEMQEEVVSAEALLEADLHNGLNPIGTVDQVVLNEDGTAVQYLINNVRFPDVVYQYADGFVSFDNVELTQDISEINVLLEEDRQISGPEELKVTRSEANNRLVSNILNSLVSFQDGEERAVEDLLIDRETGEIRHFVISMEDDSLFSAERRAIPADKVTIEDDGSITASVDFSSVREMEQQYDPTYL